MDIINEGRLNSEKSYKILIAENIPSLNKGEMSIFEGILESLKILGDFNIKILSDLPEIDIKRYEGKSEIIDVKNVIGTKNIAKRNIIFKLSSSILFFLKHIFFIINFKIFSKKILKIMKSELWKEYIESDIIIIGHNGTFGGGWGLLRTPLYFYYYYIPFVAKILKKPIILYGGSVPEYTRFKFIFEKMTRLSLNNIDLITLRENKSFENLKSLKVSNENVYLKPDLAFLMKPVNKKKSKEILSREGIVKNNSPIVGITLTNEMAYKGFEDIEDLELKYEKHLELFIKTIDYLTDELGCFIVFIPHCIGFDKNLDDRIIAKKIFERVNSKDRVKLINTEYSAKELKGIMGEFDLFIGERIHSIVNSMSMNVPSILISYSKDQRKGIIELFEQENIVYLEDIDENKLILKINTFMSNIDEIKKDIELKMNIILEEASKNGKLLKETLIRY